MWFGRVRTPGTSTHHPLKTHGKTSSHHTHPRGQDPSHPHLIQWAVLASPRLISLAKSHRIRTKLVGSESLHRKRSSRPPPAHILAVPAPRRRASFLYASLSMRDIPLGEKEINFIPLNSARLAAVAEGCHSPGALLSNTPTTPTPRRGPGVGTRLPRGRWGRQFP